ncbi:hypothetical protein CLAIMM_07492 [Cladophialophora immunda]|nr:hypothetical protein CLAIMM_07492 [Cladophialophora immunda]
MAIPFTWDPDHVLQITDICRNEIICIGRAARRFNSRCTWTIDEPERFQASSLLKSMAQKPPTEVLEWELRELAGLCLCHQAHQHQQEEAFMELQSRLSYSCDDYERFRTLWDQNRELQTEVHNGISKTLLAEISATTVKMENSNLRARETSLCRKVDEQTITMSKLQETEQTLKTQLANTSERLDRQTTALAELQEYKSGLLKTALHLEQLLEKEKLTVASLEKSCKGLEEQLAELRRKLYDQEMEVNELEASNSVLDGQLHELRQQLSKQDSAVLSLENENQTLKDQHTTAVAELGTSQLGLEQTKSELQLIQIRNFDLQRQLNEVFILGRLGISNAWLTRLRNWLPACQWLFIEAWKRVRHALGNTISQVGKIFDHWRALRGA